MATTTIFSRVNRVKKVFSSYLLQLSDPKCVGLRLRNEKVLSCLELCLPNLWIVTQPGNLASRRFDDVITNSSLNSRRYSDVTFDTKYNCLNHPEYFTKLTDKRDYQLRSKYKHKLLLPQSKLVMHSTGPNPMATKIYNKLPIQLKDIEKKCKFIKAVKDILIQKCYYTLDEFFLDETILTK